MCVIYCIILDYHSSTCMTQIAHSTGGVLQLGLKLFLSLNSCLRVP